MGGGGNERRAAARAAAIEAEKQRKIDVGTKRVREIFAEQFTPESYQKVEKDALSAWQPQLKRQYDDSLKQLKFALARSGLSSSGTYARKVHRDAPEAFDLQNQALTDKARGLATQRKTDVANAEQMTLNQLYNSADPEAAAAQAAGLSDINSQQPAYSPLGQVFTDFTAGLATQADLERSGQNRFNFGVSNWGNNTRRYAQNVAG